MDIINLTKYSSITSINVFLIVGNWNSINTVNTLIDAGCDPCIIHRIINTHTGVERQRIKQVILTHVDNQNISLLPLIKQKFNPVIYAYAKNFPEIDYTLKNGDKLKIGDAKAEIIHTAQDSKDSLCLYLENEKILFSGNTRVVRDNFQNKNSENYLKPHSEYIKGPVKIIYSSYGVPTFLDQKKVLSPISKSIKNNTFNH